MSGPVWGWSRKDRELWVRRAPPMREEALYSAFVGAEGHPILGGTLAIVEAFREDLVKVATDPQLGEKATAMALGGVEAMDNLSAELRRRVELSKSKPRGG